VYHRLRNWGMRYLQRKATDEELGMVVTFPEAFRELGGPLHDYIATIFQKSPLLEPPFFRGFYFTSAVQEGAPILDVFRKSRASIVVPERPTKAADSKAFFIHDFYARKVFPEKGLVFRSARHVSLNQRMRRVVWIGSAAMIVLMLALFGFGATGVRGLITAPREACSAALAAVEKGHARFDDLPGNLRLAKTLHQHYVDYGAPWTSFSARLLFIGANIRVPQEYVGKIHARFVLDCIFQPILSEAQSRLASTPISAAMPKEARERYLAALRTYAKWYGEVVGQHNLAQLDGQEAVLRRTEFENLLSFLGLADADRNDAAGQFEAALNTLAAHPRSFAREILRDGLHFDVPAATQTLVDAVQRITDGWKPLTQLSADNTNPMVRYWAEFANRVGELRDRYAETLALAGSFATPGQYPQAVERLLKLTDGVEHLGDPDFVSPEPGTIHEAYYNLMAFLDTEQVPESADHRIIRLNGLLEVFESQWNQEFAGLQQALEVGAPDQGREPQAKVYHAVAQGRSDLAAAFRISLTQIRTRLGLPDDEEPLTYYVNQNLIDIQEVNPPAPFEGPAKVMLSRTALGPSDRAKEYLVELRAMVGGQEEELKALQDLRQWPGLLERLRTDQPAGTLLSNWFGGVEQGNQAAPPDLVRQQSGLKDYPFWRPVDLYALARQMWSGRRASSTETLLGRMAEKAAATTKVEHLPGLARLIPGFDEPSSLPFSRDRFNMPKAPAQPETVRQTPAQPQPEEPEGEGLRRLRREPTTTPQEEPAERLQREESTALLQAYHTRDFLITTLRQFERVRAALEGVAGGARVTQALGTAADAYIDAYFTDWYGVYHDPTRLLDERTLAFIEQCGAADLSWPQYVDEIGKDENNFATALADRMEALIREVVMFDGTLGSDKIDDAIFKRVIDRLAELKRQGLSVPDQERAMRERRNMPDSGQGEPEVVYSRPLVVAWREYVREVRSLGPLTGDDQRSSGQPPDLGKLAESIVFKQATTLRFPLIAPLIDIATYGQQLLVHHLDNRLAAIFGQHNSEYPLLHTADGLDDTALLTRIGQRKTVQPKAFIELLKLIADFEGRYGELYKEVQRQDSPVHRTLHLCAAWVRFLYEEPAALTRGEPPRPLDVWLAIVRDPSGTVANAGNVYSHVTVNLPLVTTYGTPAKPLEMATRAGEGIIAGSVQEAIGNQPAEYRWDLMAGERVTFDDMTASVSDKHPDALAAYPARAVGWDLPGQPWSLLMAMGARADNDLGDGYWKIPVRMETGVDPIGFLIGLRIGSRERPFPGVIPPVENPGPRPAMTTASQYLAGPP